MKFSPNFPHAALVAFLVALLAPVSSALTLTDNFTDPANWGTPLTEAGGNMSVGSGRMNYTASSTSNSFAATLRNAPLLPATQDWSLKVDAHLNPFTLATDGQFSDVFLGFGKTGDWINTHVTFEFGRGYWGNPAKKGYYIQDDTRISGSGAPSLFSNWNVTSPDVALRMDYSAASHTLTYYFDSDGAVGGYNWAAQGSANLASGTYNLNMAPADTFTVLLVGSSAGQAVAAGQAYLSNLEITVNQSPIVTTGAASGITATTATLTGTVNPNGLATTAKFEYGLTTSYGSTASVALSPTNGSTAQTVNVSLDGLQPGATYHYRVSGFNSGGSGLGDDATFTLPMLPFGYTITNGTVTITGYTGPGGDVVIPGTINGLPVTGIGDGAFQDKAGLTRVTIPNSVTGIGSYAFAHSTSLTGVEIGNNIASIGVGAFFHCYSLTGMMIPASVTSIGLLAFELCTSLDFITVDALNSFYCSVDGVLYDKNQTTLVQYPPGKAGVFPFPASVTSIEHRALCYCTHLTAITVGTSNPVYSGMDGVLFNKSQTTLVQCPAGRTGGYTIPSSVTVIGEWAFYGCNSLTGVSIPSSVTNLMNGALASCFNLTSVTIPSSVVSIGDWAFESGRSLTDVTIPASVTSIGSRLFESCTNLKTVHFLGNAPSAGTNLVEADSNTQGYYMAGTTGWSSSLGGLPMSLFPFTYTILNGAVTITGYTGPNGAASIPGIINNLPVTSIGAGSFQNITGLTSITIPGSVTSVGDFAFGGCTSLTGVYFQGNAPSLGSDVFNGTTNASVYYLPGTTGWGSAFGSLPAVSLPYIYEMQDGGITIMSYTGPGGGVVIPGTIGGLPVVEIGDAAFYGCDVLTSVTIPASVTRIGFEAFAECHGLTSVTIPAGVTSIGNLAFDECSGMISITVDAANLNFSSLDGVLFNKPKTTLIQYPAGRYGPYTIPGSVTHIEDWAFQSCGGLTSVAMPSSVTYIGVEAFHDSWALTSMTIPASVTNIGQSALADLHGALAISVDSLNPNFSSVDGVLFDKLKTTLIQCPAGKVGAYTVPAGVSSIGADAFSECYKLTGVIIPASVANIGAGAFNECRELASVVIPASVTSIGASPFGGCRALAAITVDFANPNYVSVDGVLFDKSQTLIIQYPGGKAGAYTIPISVTSLGSEAFDDCGLLTSLTIPASVTSAGDGPPSGLTSLVSITVDAGNPILSSEDGVLFDKLKSTLILYPAGKAGSYTIPASVTGIADGAFAECGTLSSISVDAANPNYSSEDGVLFNKSKTTLIQCPGGKAGSYTIPSSVTTIGEDAFYQCRGLTSVTVPASVRIIGNWAFEECSGLASIAVDAGNPGYSSLDGVLFNKLKTMLLRYPSGKGGTYTLPASITRIGDGAFYQCGGLPSVTISASVSSIGEGAFYECGGLTSAAFAGNAPVMSWGVFGSTAPGFTVYYYNGATGFTSPTWMGYPAVNMGDSSLKASWLFANGLPYNADMQSDPNGDGVNLLMAYALKLDPNQNLAGSMPKPVIAGNQMSLTFYSGSEGVIYTVEVSTDLKVWSTAGVTFSAPDANQFRTAMVEMSGPNCFMRLGVVEGVLSPAASWLVAKGFSGTENLLEDPNGDGVNLLTAYALGMDPNQNLSGSMPEPVIAENQMNLTYYAGNGDVIYTVETSTDLQFWTTDGVLISASDTNGFRTAKVSIAGPRRFMRLKFAVLSTLPPAPGDMALIPAGNFQMGDQSNPLVGKIDEVPVHSVYVSAFYMGKYEVTNELWDGVRAWGLNNGYTDLPVGNGAYASKGANHPVHSITWYAMVKWCNARSQKEGLTPCYTVSGVDYRTGSSDAVVCNWSANGYRLPTEAEWEKAARGGVSGKNFPWGTDTISHAEANYNVYSSNGTTNYYSYDVTLRPPGADNYYYHPSYTAGGYHYTAPVDSFTPNGYGIFNMSGNVWEWCWDWYGNYSAGSQTDPRGAPSGSERVLRGGGWGGHATDCRVAHRDRSYPTNGGDNYSLGFRIARSSVP